MSHSRNTKYTPVRADEEDSERGALLGSDASEKYSALTNKRWLKDCKRRLEESLNGGQSIQLDEDEIGGEFGVSFVYDKHRKRMFAFVASDEADKYVAENDCIRSFFRGAVLEKKAIGKGKPKPKPWTYSGTSYCGSEYVMKQYEHDSSSLCLRTDGVYEKEDERYSMKNNELIVVLFVIKQLGTQNLKLRSLILPEGRVLDGNGAQFLRDRINEYVYARF